LRQDKASAKTDKHHMQIDKFRMASELDSSDDQDNSSSKVKQTISARNSRQSAGSDEEYSDPADPTSHLDSTGSTCKHSDSADSDQEDSETPHSDDFFAHITKSDDDEDSSLSQEVSRTHGLG
ncbi:hypothetical protein PSTT_01053, partial [Puccinia striiformis]